jgi:hypothetical protein
MKQLPFLLTNYKYSNLPTPTENLRFILWLDHIKKNLKFNIYILIISELLFRTSCMVTNFYEENIISK